MNTRMLLRMVSALLALPFYANAAAAAETKAAAKAVECRRVAAPPVLDGWLDDACWQAAQVADGFACLRRNPEAALVPAPDATEARVAYDAENLYLAYVCRDADIAHLKREYIPGWTRDNWTGGADSIELFVNPGRVTGRRYYHFTLSAANEGYDALIRGTKINGWDAPWDSAVAIDTAAGTWTVELRFPFLAFLAPGETCGTPAAGEEWGINFNRCNPRRPYIEANTAWNGGVFHHPNGVLRFADPAKLPGYTAQPDLLAWGKGTLAVTPVGTLPAGARYDTAVLDRTGDVAFERADSAISALMQLPYTVLTGGVTTLRLTLTDAVGKPFALRGWQFPAVPVNRELARMQSDLAAAAATLTALPRVADSADGKRLRVECEALTAAVAAQSATVRGLLQAPLSAPADWQRLREEFTTSQTRALSLARALGQARLMEPRLAAGVAVPTFGVGVMSVFDKKRPDQPFTGDVGPVRLEMAANENESAQLAVVALGVAGATELSVRFTDLQGPGGAVIPAAAGRWAVVGYVHLSQIGDAPAQDYPDPLLELPRFSVKPGQVQPLWISVRTPPAAAPGEYRGSVTIANATESVALPLTVTVWPFALPERPTIRVNLWISLDYCIRDYYGRGLTDEQVRKWLEFLGRYRIGGYHEFPRYRLTRKGGEFRFDFSASEPLFAAAEASKVNVINTSFSCNDGLLRTRFGNEIRFFNDDTGKEETIRNPAGTEHNPYGKDRPASQAHADVYTPLFRQVSAAFLRDVTTYLKAKGFGPYLVYAAVDEAPAGDRVVRRTYEWVKGVTPDVPRTFAAASPNPLDDDLIEIYCMGLGLNNAEWLARDAERAHAQGKQSWVYTSCGTCPPLPSHFVYAPAAAHRALFWLIGKYRLDGWLNWGINQWVRSESGMKGIWPEEPWKCGLGDGIAGDGYFVYPAPDQLPWSSLRLEAISDGIEDVDYLNLLRARAAELARREGASERVRRALELGEVSDRLVKNPREFSLDGNAYLAQRRAIAESIAALHQPLTP